MAHQSSQYLSCRECTYLVHGRTGTYSFRWNVSDNGTYRQTKLSLIIRNYLKTIHLASTLALQITSTENVTPEDVQTIYREFRERPIKSRNAFTKTSAAFLIAKSE
ncbi:hypothetical protein VA249_09580 [Vibrio alfacsensis]|nr:hypothetical protein VA249_09580 [Vibrio alfacsensis]